MRFLSGCAIIKDEARTLREWLFFHELMGVEHFYLFDNNSTDGTRAVLRPFVERGFVTLIPWRAHPGQMVAYEYALRSFGSETRWLAFIDADEFLHGIRENDLRAIVADYEPYSALAVHWKVFGTSGHKGRPRGLVIENYTMRASDSFGPNGHTKSIVKVSEALHPKDPHLFVTRKGTVTETGRVVDVAQRSLQAEWSTRRIAINHYFTKSEQDWADKLRRGRAMVARDHPDFLRRASIFASHNRNDVEDTTVQRFVPALRALCE